MVGGFHSGDRTQSGITDPSSVDSDAPAAGAFYGLSSWFTTV